jgi:seryl-tRNA synthetase
VALHQYLRSEIQSIEDLRKKWVKIRSAIAKANTDNTITIGSTTKSINEWLNWKREVAQEESKFAVSVHVRIKNAMDESVQKPQVVKDDSGQVKICKLLANLEYPEFLKKSQEVDEILETLDGKLSLKNATIMVEI